MAQLMETNRLTYSRLKSYCQVQTSSSEDRFVGFRILDNSPQVCFPLGYRFPVNYEQLQADIKSLIFTIQRAAHSHPEIKFGREQGDASRIPELPFKDYIVLIEDYLQTSMLYTETLYEYRRSTSGVVSWPHTIARMKPALSSYKQPVYLEFITKRTRRNEDALVTLIHEHCLFLAFNAVGWLFTPRKFPKPRLFSTNEEHLHIVTRRLGTVFNDRNRRILSAMLNILSCDSSSHQGSFEFGTDKFEYAWEYMVDRAFGEHVDEKRKYFPSADWELIAGNIRTPAPLEPDTIMTCSNNLYVLDAKYYRFGITGNPLHLPGTSDIGKQVIYGQYARRVTSGVVESIYNAFIIPGEVSSAVGWCTLVAIAKPNWIDNPKSHEHVMTIIVDTAYLLSNYCNSSDAQKLKLKAAIENKPATK